MKTPVFGLALVFALSSAAFAGGRDGQEGNNVGTHSRQSGENNRTNEVRQSGENNRSSRVGESAEHNRSARAEARNSGMGGDGN